MHVLRRKRSTKWEFCILFALLAIQISSAARADDLILGVLPRRNPSEMVEMFHPLATYLSRRIGYTVHLETTPNFPEFSKAIAAKRYHIAHTNQMQYVQAHKLHGYEVIAMNEEANRATIRSAIVVRKDSGYKSIEDLRGKTIIFGDREAFAAYMMPTHLLRKHGLRAGDYKEDFAITPSNVPLAVYYRQADAGGTGDSSLEMPWLHDKIDVTELTLLEFGEPVSHLPWSVSPEVSKELREKIRAALLEIKSSPEGAAVLQAATLTNIVNAKDSDYESIRQLIKAFR